MRNLSAIVIFALTIQGCVEIPIGDSNVVRTIDEDSDFNCEHLGFVSGEGPMGWTTAHDAEGALHEVENKAVRLGGNAIRVINMDSNVTSTVITADVYKCEFPE